MTPKSLDETDLYVLFHEYEEIFLFEKDTNEDLWRTEMPVEPTCGLIGFSNEWALVGGAELIVWKNDTLKVITDNDLKWAYEMRWIGENQALILTDPWMENSAIWEFEVYTEQKKKVRDFREYYGKPYAQHVEW